MTTTPNFIFHNDGHFAIVLSNKISKRFEQYKKKSHTQIENKQIAYTKILLPAQALVLITLTIEGKFLNPAV